ncbi:MAG: hypothetical protein KDD44_13185 [Bdellovibrionales bacterium]|nr:hypothetical protein [Bdellovibrionales bacterium]
MKDFVHSNWSYVALYLVIFALMILVDAQFGSSKDLFRAWVVLQLLVQGIQNGTLPEKYYLDEEGITFIASQQTFGDAALFVASLIVILLPAVLALVCISLLRSLYRQ